MFFCFFVIVLAKTVFLCAIASASEITIRLDNPPETGTIIFLLFDSANTFTDYRDAAVIVTESIVPGKVYLIDNVPSGEYALMAHYDENENGVLDKNLIGIPTEFLGFSNRYEPKAPPSYSRASFVLLDKAPQHFDVKLYRPLGKLGRVGVGVGVIARSSPYRDSTEGVFQPIPAITYIGDRVQIFGPKLQVGILGSGRLRLAATGRYRVGVYEEDDSSFLVGMGDRQDTFMGGLALEAELPGGIDLSVSYERDILDQIGGSEARAELDKAFQFGTITFSPATAVNWIDESFSNHDFGVSESQSRINRPAYALDDIFSAEGGLGILLEVTSDWLIIVDASVEFLPEQVTKSPIVGMGYVVKGFAAINYVF